MKVIKFGGSSIADTNKLKLAAQKTISFLESGGDVVFSVGRVISLLSL